jgi:hypothetical protein
MSVRRVAKVIVLVLFAICCPRLSDAAGLTIGWDPPSDGSATGYILYYGTASQSYSGQVDVGNTTSYTLSGLSDGTTYYVAIRAYDTVRDMSSLSAEVSATTLPAVTPVVTGLSVTASVAAPQIVGTTVNWLAAATGGVAPYQFQWSLYSAGNWASWPWTTSSTWAWTPSTPGTDYQVKVAVRSSGSSSTSGEMSQAVPFTVTALTASSSFTLSTSGFKLKGVTGANLTWRGASGSNVDVYRNSSKIATTPNSGAFTDKIGTKGSGTFTYKVCAGGTATCSNNSTVVF